MDKYSTQIELLDNYKTMSSLKQLDYVTPNFPHVPLVNNYKHISEDFLWVKIKTDEIYILSGLKVKDYKLIAATRIDDFNIRFSIYHKKSIEEICNINTPDKGKKLTFKKGINLFETENDPTKIINVKKTKPNFYWVRQEKENAPTERQCEKMERALIYYENYSAFDAKIMLQHTFCKNHIRNTKNKILIK